MTVATTETPNYCVSDDLVVQTVLVKTAGEWRDMQAVAREVPSARVHEVPGEVAVDAYVSGAVQAVEGRDNIKLDPDVTAVAVGRALVRGGRVVRLEVHRDAENAAPDIVNTFATRVIMRSVGRRRRASAV